MLGKCGTNNKYNHAYSFMETLNIVGNIPKKGKEEEKKLETIYMYLKVFTTTIHSNSFLDEYQNILRCQDRSK